MRQRNLSDVRAALLFVYPANLSLRLSLHHDAVQYFFAILHVTAPLNFTTMVQPHRDTAVYHDVVPLCDSTRHSTQGCP